MTTSAKINSKSAATKPVAKAPAKKPAIRSTTGAAAASKAAAKAAAIPAELPDFTKRFKMLTGIDNSEFCAKVRLHLDNGYELHGSPVMAFNSMEGKMYVGQAVVLKGLPAKKKTGKKK
jgi:hypothetical protein